jgi:spore coat protein A
VGGPVPAFRQIGSDQGFLPAPLALEDLLIAPAERMDVVIDFSRFAGRNFVIANDAKAPYPDGDDIVPTQVMQFRVDRPLQSRDTSRLPDRLVPVPALDTGNNVRARNIALTELASAQDNPIMGLLGQAHWDDPVTETPRAGATELWRLINTTGDAHPIHVHLVRFQILNRQPFDADRYLATGELAFTGPPEAPAANERPAWKDTARTMPGFVTRVVQRFELPTGTRVSPGQRFPYVFHCHILEHEDNEMMRPYDVIG